jgi:peptidyl-prolyl cis-trans isomerase SurA
MRKNKSTIMIWLLVLASAVSAGEVLDGIAATIDNHIILISEIESQVQLYIFQMNADNPDKSPGDSLRREILNKMIDEKLILIEAENDTSIKVENTEIDEALTTHIKRIKQQFPSEQAFQAQLTAEGLTLKELRSRYKDEIKNQLYKEKFLNKRLQQITVSSGEVKEFYRNYIDSLPQHPAGVHLAHILISTGPGPAAYDSLKAYARVLYDKARAGENFALLADTYSDDRLSTEGGDLGWFGKGDMVPEFENAAFALEPGEISDIIETEYGFHIIRCTGKKEDQVRASHILVKFVPSEEDVKSSELKADSVYNLLLESGDFEEMAARFSDDKSTAENGGDLGWYSADNLYEEFKQAVAKLEPGEFSRPVVSQYGFHILKVLEKESSRPLDYKDDYSDIEAIAKRHKAQKELDDWLKDARKKHYIETKI